MHPSTLRQAQDRQSQGERILTLALLAFRGGLQSEWLEAQVGQRVPQPFHRAVVESSNPPDAERNLGGEDGKGNEEAERGPYLSEEAETIAVKERGRDERLQQIVAQGHAPDRSQRAQTR